MEEGPNQSERWGKDMESLVLRISSLAAEVSTAESVAERLACEAREKGVSRCYRNAGSPNFTSCLESSHILISEEKKSASTECSVSLARQG